VADQSTIWNEVADPHRKGAIHSPTGAMRDGYVQRAGQLEQIEGALKCPTDDPVGVLAMAGGRALFADLFDHPDTSCAYWSGLVRSFALESIAGDRGLPDFKAASRLLRDAAAASYAVFASPRLGLDLRVSGQGVAGAALVHTTVVHTALFPYNGMNSGDPRLQRPGERLRRRVQQTVFPPARGGA